MVENGTVIRRRFVAPRWRKAPTSKSKLAAFVSRKEILDGFPTCPGQSQTMSQTHPRTLCTLGKVLAFLCIATLSSCQGYGGKPVGKRVHVSLRTKPEGARAFIIPEEEWYRAGENKYKDTNPLAGDSWFDKYEIKQGRTNLSVEVYMYTYVFVAEKDGRKNHRMFTGGTDEIVELSLE